MSAQKHIKMIMLDNGIKTKDLADALGMSNIYSAYNKLSRDTMSYGEAEKIADLLECDIIWRSRETGKEY